MSENKPCFHCGGITRPTYGGKFKCRICGQVQEPRKSGIIVPMKLRVFSHPEGVKLYAQTQEWMPGGRLKELSQEQVGPEPPEEEGITPDIHVFIRRLTESLTPAVGYSPEITQDILATRSEYRKSLYDVFEEKSEWLDWFDKTKTRTGLHRSELMQKIVDALEDLADPDAVALREGYEQALSGGLLG